MSSFGRVSFFDPVPSELPRAMLTGHTDCGMFKMAWILKLGQTSMKMRVLGGHKAKMDQIK